MPLVICPDCGHQCSPQAVACTDCGRPIAGSVTPPPTSNTIAALHRPVDYGRSTGASILIALSVLLGIVGLIAEFASGTPAYGAYIVALLFGVWARIAQAHAHQRAVIDRIGAD